MASVADIFDLAWKHHQANDFATAERLYRQAVQMEPAHADAWCFLGAVCQSQGRLAEAEANFRRAVQLMPSHPCAQNYLGIVLAQQGKRDEAAMAFQQFLVFQPADADAHNNLGMVRAEQGRLEEAITCHRRALQLRPDDARTRASLEQVLRRKNAYANQPSAPAVGRGSVGTNVGWDAGDVAQAAYALNLQGVTFARQGRLEEAKAHFERVLTLQPDNADAHNNLGIIFGMQRRFDDAILQYQHAISCKPDSAESHYNLGTVFQQQGKLDEAVGYYQAALRLMPDHVDAHSNLGIIFLEQNRLDEAKASFQHALQLKPDHVDACNNLGNTWLKQERLDEAESCYRQALRIRPDYAATHANLGHTLARQDKLDEAIRCFREAARIDPRSAEAFNGLGLTLWRQGQCADALSAIQEALRCDPGHVDAHVNRALLWLLLGNWEEGWPEMEWRWRHRDSVPWLTKDFLREAFAQPRWDGSPLDGRTILVVGEQGLGDTLQLVRYVPWIKERGGTVIVQCQAPLVELLGSMPEIDHVLAWRAPLPEFDLHMPMLSLPALFHSTPNTIPRKVPYLLADAVRVERWREELARVRGQGSGVRSRRSEVGSQKSEVRGQDARTLLVGITWQGSRTHKGDGQRSVSLAQFVPLSRVEGVQLCSLQVGHGAEKLAGWDAFPVTDLGSQFDPANIADAAAALMSLDLVVTVDTGIAHLAGALGVPVWVVLPVVPDWRWRLKGEETPWYPTMLLFRQTRYGQWDDVLERIAEELKCLTE